MWKKKRVATEDLPISEPGDTIPWDPAGANIVPSGDDHSTHGIGWQAQQTATLPSVDDPDLQQFLQAISTAKDADSEFVTITPETTP